MPIGARWPIEDRPQLTQLDHWYSILTDSPFNVHVFPSRGKAYALIRSRGVLLVEADFSKMTDEQAAEFILYLVRSF